MFAWCAGVLACVSVCRYVSVRARTVCVCVTSHVRCDSLVIVAASGKCVRCLCVCD